MYKLRRTQREVEQVKLAELKDMLSEYEEVEQAIREGE